MVRTAEFRQRAFKFGRLLYQSSNKDAVKAVVEALLMSGGDIAAVICRTAR
jgi:hypothetical protein